MKYLSIILLISVSLFSFTQEEKNIGKFVHTFSSHFHQYRMDNLNATLTDTSTGLYAVYNGATISSGMRYSYDISYRPISNKFDFGMHFSYQEGKGNGVKHIDSVYDPWIGWIPAFDIFTKIRTRSYNLGLFAKINVNELMGWSTKTNMLKNTIWAVAPGVNYGFSRFNSSHRSTKANNESQLADHGATDINYSVSSNLGYRFDIKGIVLELGLSVGYQQYKTSIIESKMGTMYSEDNQHYDIHLDFSGFNYGFYVSLGK